MYDIQHCFICRPTDSTVSEDAGIKPRTVVTTALAVRGSNHSARSYPHSARFHPLSARSHPHSARSHPLSARFHPHSARSHPLSARFHPHSGDLIHAQLDLIHISFITIYCISLFHQCQQHVLAFIVTPYPNWVRFDLYRFYLLMLLSRASVKCFKSGIGWRYNFKKGTQPVKC